MKKNKIKLSILDQSPINKGKTAIDALKEATELAILTDKLGYTRFWVSEHHNATTFAGLAPEILVAHLASHTQRMRIGSGGIMLPNHSTLKMAENFKLLEVLYPHRIDMGIGRAPGTDRRTASLLNSTNVFDERDYINQLQDLQAYLHNTDKRIAILPSVKSVPDLWILTSSGESAFIAAHYGMALSYAQFINANSGVEVIKAYREKFNPSIDLKKPMVNVALFVFCNEDEEIVIRQRALLNHWYIQLERGVLESVNYDDIKNTKYTDAEQRRIDVNHNKSIYGTPDEVKERLTDLTTEYDIDEIMTITYAEDFKHRLHSYEILADMFDLV